MIILISYRLETGNSIITLVMTPKGQRKGNKFESTQNIIVKIGFTFKLFIFTVDNLMILVIASNDCLVLDPMCIVSELLLFLFYRLEN